MFRWEKNGNFRILGRSGDVLRPCMAQPFTIGDAPVGDVELDILDSRWPWPDDQGTNGSRPSWMGAIPGKGHLRLAPHHYGLADCPQQAPKKAPRITELQQKLNREK